MSGTYEQRGFTVPPDAIELIVVRHGASAPLSAGETFVEVRAFSSGVTATANAFVSGRR